MTCTPAQCASCTKSCLSGVGNGDIERSSTDKASVEEQLQAALERAQRAEQAYEKLVAEQKVATAAQNGHGIPELKPLRSQAWFNNGGRGDS